jgi:hypothetical protein
MNTPFRLDDHKRRSQPLAPPPYRYFDQLPSHVMARVQTSPDTGLAGTWDWLRHLSAPMRTALASAVVLGGFATSFWLTQPTAPVAGSTAALAAVSQAEMVQYLLASDQRVTLSDLAEFSTTPPDLSEAYLQASAAEVQDALDSQPSEDPYY